MPNNVQITVSERFAPGVPFSVVVRADGEIVRSFDCDTRGEAELIAEDIVKLALELGGRRV